MKNNNNNFLAVIVCLLFLGACTQQQQSGGDFSDGLVSHFTFTKDGVDLLQSNIQIINHGSSLGAGRIGEKGNSFKFDGTTSYAEIPHNQAFEFDDNNFSISIWIKHPSQLSTEVVPQFVFIKSSIEIPLEGIALIVDYPKRGFISFRIHYDEPFPSKTSYLDNNQWEHIVCVKDGDMLNLYLNGKLDNSRKIKKLPKISNKAPLTIGSNQINHKDNFEGLIDDFRVYKRPLSQEEVINLYNYELKTVIE